MKCTPFYYSGLSDCDMLFKDVVGAMILDKGATLSDPAAKATYTDKFAVYPATGMFAPIMRGYQNNTAEPERNTSAVGFTEKTSDPLPMLVGFLDKSYCDYKTLYALDGAEKDIVLFLKNGRVWHSQDATGNKIGFRVKVSIRKNAPGADNSVENFPLYFDFMYIEDLDNALLTTLNFSVKELADAVPVGLNGVVTTAYSSGTVTVDLKKRCTLTPYAGATATTNWEVLYTENGSTDLDVDVTTVGATSAAIGRYVLTIKKDASGTPANLTKGAWIQARVMNGVTATKLDYVSQPIFIKV